MVSIQFLGGAGTTTGSKHLITTDDARVLVDCGLFQGLKELRLRNWQPFPIGPHSIQSLILTHAHIDHSGYLPRFVKNGFAGPVYATAATCDLAAIMLRDSAHIQEEDARYANMKGFSKHKPALPLYTVADAEAALKLFKPCDYDKIYPLSKSLEFELREAGHILGSATAEVRINNRGQKIRILFSGDLGRPNMPIIKDPEKVGSADYLVLESTYGNRLHPPDSIPDMLASLITSTIGRGGSVIVPSFAVGRTQTLLYLLRELLELKRIPKIPVYVDSPMAVDVTDVFAAHPEDHDLDMTDLMRHGRSPFNFDGLHMVRSVEESKKLNSMNYPAIIIASNGMATVGRILHHLARRLPDPKNTVLFVGYQAAGTRGRALIDGAKEVKIHGESVRVRASIVNASGLSAHADYREILEWLGGFSAPPKMTFIVHGEPDASAGLAERIKTTLNWPVHVARPMEEVSL
jgi:metallo-beta-lactamase family protein